ncbi:MAG TPA: response regulator transcription factor [Bacillales bacterium]|nr:response regulator transcription factor [Bacillales bacterium]
MGQTILVVEDEASIITLLEYNLSKAGFDVASATDGEKGMELAEKQQPDLVLLDLMLPKMDGLEVCKQLRRQNKRLPIIMLTAKDDEFDKVLGLELGADDYITKPFSPREVVARVKAVLRRSHVFSDRSERDEEEETVMKIGDMEIYPLRYEVFMNGEIVDLTPKQFELLVYLAENKGRVLSREQLLNAIWAFDYTGDTRIVDVHVSHLREKFETDKKNPGYIKTVRGFGYKLEAPQ